jgi:branched-chain amino acid transport system substrate-binding protein
MKIITYVRMAVSGLAFLTAAAAPAVAQDAKSPIRIGVLSDMSGHLADMSGPGTVQAVKMAVADFGGTVLGRPVEVVSADHLNKPDIGLAIARKWFDADNVGLVLDVNNSSLALAVQSLAREKNKIVVYGGAFASDLTGTACSPNGMAWVTDTYAQTHPLAVQFVKSGLKTWYALTPDYAFGIAAQRDVQNAVTAAGGNFLGAARVPSPISDTSSFILQAQASNASVVELLQGGDDLQGVIKTAHEFGLGLAGGTHLSAFILWVSDVRGLGLEAAQGISTVNAFYWDQDDATRAWSKRYFDVTHREPEAVQAAMYSAAKHYLEAIRDAGTDDTTKVLAKMHETPVNDFMTHNAHILPTGRVARELYIFEVKKPAESKGPWDVFKQVAEIPADQTIRPASEGSCPLAKN